jgi:DNA-directed RNA polymerase sigma subunit (sigma70/sigma32)
MQVEEWYRTYVPVREIARRLYRSVGVIRQLTLQLNLHRSTQVSMCLKWAPRHLAVQATELDPQAFCDACFAWRAEHRAAKAARKLKQRALKALQLKLVCADIDQTPLSRNAKIYAKRQAGMTLEAVSKQHGITRERVRQIQFKEQWRRRAHEVCGHGTTPP